MLDCQDFLHWQLDMVERCKTCEDGLLKLVIPMVLQYIDEFVQCEILSRKLVFQVCAIISCIKFKEARDLVFCLWQVSKRIASLLAIDANGEVLNSIDVGNCSQHRGAVAESWSSRFVP